MHLSALPFDHFDIKLINLSAFRGENACGFTGLYLRLLLNSKKAFKELVPSGIA